MNCFYCGYEIDREEYCPICGANLREYRRVRARGQQLYNEGLRRAQNREISSAIENLETALHCDKGLTDARNLLGLCYYEIGETVLALNEWVISKNLQPEGNRVDLYLDQIQKSRSTLDKITNTMHKFNQAVRYCKEGNRDLARIQLKRVMEMNPHMVKAYQLFALCQIADGNYEEAARALKVARRIDASDPVTVRYSKETREGLKKAAQLHRGSRRRLPRASILGSDEIPLEDRRSVLDYFDGVRGSFLNILVGIITGILISVFLIYPAVRAHNNSTAADALVSANQQKEASDTSISSLQKQVESLQSQLSNYTGKADAVTSYENLIEAKRKLAANDQAGAYQAFSSVNRDLLGDTGKADYDELNNKLADFKKKSAYTAGNTAYSAGNWQEAVNQYLPLVQDKASAGYEDGAALYRLASAYNKLGDRDNAVKYYEQLLTDLTGSHYRTSAKKDLKGLGVTVNKDNSFTDSNAQGSAPEAGQDSVRQNNANLQTR